MRFWKLMLNKAMNKAQFNAFISYSEKFNLQKHPVTYVIGLWMNSYEPNKK